MRTQDEAVIIAASDAPEEPIAAAPTWLSGGRLSRATLLEVAVLVGLAAAYTVVRAAQGTDVAAALEHGRNIADFEHWLVAHLELPLNQWLASAAIVAVPACYFYAVFHYLATPLILFQSWRVGGWVYRRGYWSIVIASAFALIVYAGYPVAPPRLLPDLGAVDVMREFADYGWWGEAASAPRAIGDATNQYAAMPSLHFGWSLWCAIQMWSFTGLRWRVAAVAYPTLQILVVVATANHFVLDVVGGAVCVLGALGLVTAARYLWLRVRRGSPSPEGTPTPSRRPRGNGRPGRPARGPGRRPAAGCRRCPGTP